MYNVNYDKTVICFHFELNDENIDIYNCNASKLYFKKSLLKRYQITDDINILNNFLTDNKLSLNTDFLNKLDDIIYSCDNTNQLFVLNNDLICNAILNFEKLDYKQNIFIKYHKNYNNIDDLIKYEVFKTNSDFLKYFNFKIGNIFEIIQYSGFNSILLINPSIDFINLLKENNITYNFIYAEINLHDYNQTIINKIIDNKNDELKVIQYRNLIIENPYSMIEFYGEYDINYNVIEDDIISV